MNGKLIVLDGLDGSGKSTQAQLLYEKLKKQTDKVMLISYPDYSDPSSTLVKMYLQGDFSDHPDEVNAYAASSFYAVDRYASYMRFWKKPLEDGWIIIASRYVSSNAIHQMVKLPKSQWDIFLEWLEDYEYEKLGLPRPDCVIFLDMSREVANQLILARYHGDETKKDIHEKDIAYLSHCMESAHYAAQKQGWRIVRCCDGQKPLSIETIAANIDQQVKEVL